MTTKLLVANLVSTVALLGGIYLAATGKEGWGWCFLIAVICHCSPSSK